MDYLLSPLPPHRGDAEESVSFPCAGQREGSLHLELQILAFPPGAPGCLPLEGRGSAWRALLQSCSVSLGDFKSNPNKAKPHTGGRDRKREAARSSGKNMSYGERSRFGSPVFRILLHKTGRVVSVLKHYYQDWRLSTACGRCLHEFSPFPMPASYSQPGQGGNSVYYPILRTRRVNSRVSKASQTGNPFHF